MEENITQETNDLTGNDNSSSASKKSEAAPSKEERDTSPVTTVTETTTEKQSFERVYPLHREDSYFDGTSLQLIGWKFLGCLVSLFSFGLCTGFWVQSVSLLSLVCSNWESYGGVTV